MELQRNIIDNREETEEFIASMDDYTTVVRFGSEKIISMALKAP
jgi:hypothetical protein